MLQKTTKEFRKFFILQFTKELIKHSTPIEVFELKNIIKEEEKKTKDKIKKQVKKPTIQMQSPIPKPIISPQRRVLKIPAPKLPSALQYLKPTPSNTEIDLGKLNDLLKDPLVNLIECDGADANIIVKGNMGIKKTNIVLSKKEIDEVINKFSATAKIPLSEGVFKIAVGKLILSAIVSEVISSKFIIQKMTYNPNPFLRR